MTIPQPCKNLWNCFLRSPRINGAMLFLWIRCSRTWLILRYVCFCGTYENASFFSSNEVEDYELHTVCLCVHLWIWWLKKLSVDFSDMWIYNPLKRKANSDFIQGMWFVIRFIVLWPCIHMCTFTSYNLVIDIII